MNLLKFWYMVVCYLSHVLIQVFKPRHRRYYKQAVKVLNTVNSLEHSGQKILYLKKISPYVFEELLLIALRNNGYIVKRNSSYSGDGGVDGKFYHPKHGWCYIQAKRYKDFIKSEDVSKFAEFCRNKKTIGLFIHTGKTSTSSKILANDSENVKIISGDILIKLISCLKR